jgi:hypothetical protein
VAQQAKPSHLLDRGGRITQQQLRDAGWEVVTHGVFANSYDAAMVEAALHRRVRALGLRWGRRLNRQVGGGGVGHRINFDPHVVATTFCLSGHLPFETGKLQAPLWDLIKRVQICYSHLPPPLFSCGLQSYLVKRGFFKRDFGLSGTLSFAPLQPYPHPNHDG